MSLPLVAVAVLVIAVSLAMARPTLPRTTPSPSPESTVTPSLSPTSSLAPTATPSLPPTTSTPTQVTSSSWSYPGATVVENGGALVLTSNASPETITNWYREQIEARGFNIRNSIKTSANDVVKNVLQATKNSESINVEITKNPPETTTRIKVETRSL